MGCPSSRLGNSALTSQSNGGLLTPRASRTILFGSFDSSGCHPGRSVCLDIRHASGEHGERQCCGKLHPAGCRAASEHGAGGPGGRNRPYGWGGHQGPSCAGSNPVSQRPDEAIRLVMEDGPHHDDDSDDEDQTQKAGALAYAATRLLCRSETAVRSVDILPERSLFLSVEPKYWRSARTPAHRT